MPDTLPFDPTAPKVLPKPGKRKPLTRAQIIEIAQRQSGNAIPCGCGCGKVLRPKCVDEHVTARHTLTPELADRIDNRALYNPECAKAKTVKDQAVIAKGRHTRRESGQQKRRAESGSRLKSPGFKSRPEGVPSALSKSSRNYRKQKFNTRKA